MFGKRKHKALILSVIISTLFLYSCSTGSVDEVQGFEIQGETQGTTYTIIVAENEINFIKAEIDSILHQFDLSLSTYHQESVISEINRSDKGIRLKDPFGYFENCYRKAMKVYYNSRGAFDPTVYPLVEGWGFMKKMETPLEKHQVDSLLKMIGFGAEVHHSIQFDGDSIYFSRKTPGFKLDFNAIAQGYSVDILADFIEGRGHRNFYVEIGGELYVKGLNRQGKDWIIGIDSPEESKTDGRVLENVVHLSNRAIATSGNYRNYYVKNGVKYAHTLNPKTGYPVIHNLLSATVFANDVMTADAYATAFMVMGKENAIQFIERNPELEMEVYFLYSDQQGKVKRYFSESLRSKLDN